MDNQYKILKTLGLFAMMLLSSLGIQSYLAAGPNRELASVDSAVVAKAVAPSTLASTSSTSKKAALAKSKDLPPPTMAWMQWGKFNQIVDRLNQAGVTDAERLKLMKQMSLALTRNLKSLTPEQVRRSLATITDDSIRLEALEDLAGATRYNKSDIPVMTQPFNNLKDDAHVLLVGMGGMGGY